MPDSLTVVELRKLSAAVRERLNAPGVDKDERIALETSAGQIGKALAVVYKKMKPRGRAFKAKKREKDNSTTLAGLMR